MDEIRFLAGPIVQRHYDKVEEERQALQKAREEAEAAKKAAQEAAKQAEEASKRANEAAAKATGDLTTNEGDGVANGGSQSDPVVLSSDDAEMKDVETVKPDAVEEAGEGAPS